MAERNPLKIADQMDLSDDDPFAELTRIMGFDPRQPSRPATAERHAAATMPALPPMDARAAVPATSLRSGGDEAIDDFDIDLEKELLVEFTNEQEPVRAFAQARSGRVDGPTARAAVEPDLRAYSEPPADELVAAQPAVDPEIEFDFGEALHQELGAVQDDLLPSGPAAAFQEQDFVGEGYDGGGDPLPATAGSLISDDELVGGLDELVLGDTADVDGGLDGQLVAEFDAAMLDPGIGPPAEDGDPVADLAAVVGSTPHEQEDDLGADFDAAMADIDMDFAPESAPQAFQPVTEQDEDEQLAELVAPGSADDEPRLAELVDTRSRPEEFRLAELVGPEPIEDDPLLTDSDLGDLDLALSAEFPQSADFSETRDIAAASAAGPDWSGQDVSGQEWESRQAGALAAVEYVATGETVAADDDLALDLGEAFPEQYYEDEQQIEDDERQAGFAYDVQPESASDDRYDLSQVATEPAAGQPPLIQPVDMQAELDALFADSQGYDTRSRKSDSYDDEAPSHRDEEEGSYDGPVNWDMSQPAVPPVAARASAQGYSPASDRFAQPGYKDMDLDRVVAELAGEDTAKFDKAAAARARAAELLAAPREPIRQRERVNGEDPLSVINALAEKYSVRGPQGWAVQPPQPARRGTTLPRARQLGAPVDQDLVPVSAFQDLPEIDTVDVPDRAVALADDLDIPELPFGDDEPVATMDDLEEEFSNLMGGGMQGQSQPRHAPSTIPLHREPQRRAGRADILVHPAVAAAAPQRVTPLSQPNYSDPAAYDPMPQQAYAPQQQAGRYEAANLDYDHDLENEISLPGMEGMEEQPEPRKRGVLVAALVGAMALVGGIGAFALSSGGGEDGAPVLVKAEDGPIKVRPENPGGTTVPNQDNKVYDTVAGAGGNALPVQDKLVTAAEEPVDMTPPPAEEEVVAEAPAAGETAVPVRKSEDRIEQMIDADESGTDPEVVAIAPRVVRTMVVKPDGSLVEREVPAPAAAVQDVAIREAPAVTVPESTGTTQAEAAAPVAPTRQAEVEAVVDAAPQEAAAEEPATASAATPENVPVAPQRPADQPIEVVGEVPAQQPQQVASAATTAVAAGGAWSMQIASQPSQESAQASYQDLARRYSAVLDGRSVNIVKAEIAGKGTFWRVRVPAGTRDEAINLCASYKQAGGNCFVSR